SGCSRTCTGSSAGSGSSPSSASPSGRPSRSGGAARGRDPATPNAIFDFVIGATSAERKPWHAIFRLLERDERAFAVLLAVVMVGGVATLGLVPLRPRHRIDLYHLVIWFAAYKVGVFALVTVNPRATGTYFAGALGIDMLLVFALLAMTGGGDSPFVNLFFPLVAVNAYYFGRWIGLLLTAVAGLLYWTAAWLAPPEAAWTAVVILMGLVGLPAFAVGLVAAIRDQVTALDALTEEYLAFARFPRPHFEEESVNHLAQELADFIRPVATRQGLTVRVEVDPTVPMMEIDRGLLRQAVLNLVKNGLEALSSGGELTIGSRLEGESVEISVSDTGGGIAAEVEPRLFEQFFTN